MGVRRFARNMVTVSTQNLARAAKTGGGLKYAARRLRHSPTKATPNYHIYELIWSVPDQYGGMTSAMLARCQQLVRHGVGESLTILTLSNAFSKSKVHQHIRDRWGLPSRVVVRNIWNDLRTMSDAELKTLNGSTPANASKASSRDGGVQLRTGVYGFMDETNSPYRREHLRADGTILLIDQCAKPEQRLLTLYDSAGFPVVTWRSEPQLYAAWLNYAIINRPAVLINEDKKIGEFLTGTGFEFDQVKRVQIVHGTHLTRPHRGPFAALSKFRSNTLRNLELFDMVVLLTEGQKRDIETLGIGNENIRVIPNFTDIPRGTASQSNDREPGAGIVLGKLTPLKRTDHAVRAIATMHSRDAATSATLDIVGDGPERDALRALIRESAAHPFVRLLGHVENAADTLDNYSFSIVTSKTEGFGLAILESMAHGCVPICYNIRYGPSDLISNGVNGFLVESGNIRALEDAIQRFIELPAAERDKLRNGARASAQHFGPSEVIERWRSELNKIWLVETKRNQNNNQNCRAYLQSAELSGSTLRVEVTIHGAALTPRINWNLVVVPRERDTFVKIRPSGIKSLDHGSVWRFEFRGKDLMMGKRTVFDFYVQPVGAGWADNIRVHAGAQRDAADFADCRLYATKYGNFSVECR